LLLFQQQTGWLGQGIGYSKSCLWMRLISFSPDMFIIKSLIGSDNENLSFTASGGNTEPIYASGYVCVLVGVIKCCK
jgi:hypothetical protein